MDTHWSVKTVWFGTGSPESGNLDRSTSIESSDPGCVGEFDEQAARTSTINKMLPRLTKRPRDIASSLVDGVTRLLALRTSEPRLSHFSCGLHRDCLTARAGFGFRTPCAMFAARATSRITHSRSEVDLSVALVGDMELHGHHVPQNHALGHQPGEPARLSPVHLDRAQSCVASSRT